MATVCAGGDSCGQARRRDRHPRAAACPRPPADGLWSAATQPAALCLGTGAACRLCRTSPRFAEGHRRHLGAQARSGRSAATPQARTERRALRSRQWGVRARPAHPRRGCTIPRCPSPPAPDGQVVVEHLHDHDHKQGRKKARHVQAAPGRAMLPAGSNGQRAPAALFLPRGLSLGLQNGLLYCSTRPRCTLPAAGPAERAVLLAAMHYVTRCLTRAVALHVPAPLLARRPPPRSPPRPRGTGAADASPKAAMDRAGTCR